MLSNDVLEPLYPRSSSVGEALSQRNGSDSLPQRRHEQRPRSEGDTHFLGMRILESWLSTSMQTSPALVQLVHAGTRLSHWGLIINMAPLCRCPISVRVNTLTRLSLQRRQARRTFFGGADGGGILVQVPDPIFV